MADEQENSTERRNEDDITDILWAGPAGLWRILRQVTQVSKDPVVKKFSSAGPEVGTGTGRYLPTVLEKQIKNVQDISFSNFTYPIIWKILRKIADNSIVA